MTLSEPFESSVWIEPPVACRTLVVGLGNPILGDDSVGWCVVEDVERQWTTDGIEVLAIGGPRSTNASGKTLCAFAYLSVGGLSLMEHLIGYDRAIIVDAMTGVEPIGRVEALTLDAFPEPTSSRVAGVHDASLQTALRLGRSLGITLPRSVWVIGVAADRLDEFREDLSAEVAAAVGVASQRVVDLLAQEEEPDGIT